ncbi:MAG: hypothetical protein L0956_05895, partial [Candidatus Mariimomonas ferrooxydans]
MTEKLDSRSESAVKSTKLRVASRIILSGKSFPGINSNLVFLSASGAENFVLRELMTYQEIETTCQYLISSAHLFLLLQSGDSCNIFFTRPASTLPQPSLT